MKIKTILTACALFSLISCSGNNKQSACCNPAPKVCCVTPATYSMPHNSGHHIKHAKPHGHKHGHKKHGCHK